jgi:hypothetical protein
MASPTRDVFQYGFTILRHNVHTGGCTTTAGGPRSIIAAALPTLRDIYLTTYRFRLKKTTMTFTASIRSLITGIIEQTVPTRNMSVSQHLISHRLPFFRVSSLCNKSKDTFLETQQMLLTLKRRNVCVR